MKHLLSIALAIIVLSACSTQPKEGVMLLMETSKGNMKIKLYDETPQHRDNFVKLAEEGFYDSLLFHRVINEFMIQGGDPESKGAASGAMLGNGGPGYQVPAEINYPTLFHKKGALAAARTGDNVNPERKSSGSQFYIVQGKTYNDEGFTAIEKRYEDMKRQQLFYQTLEDYKDTLQILQQAGNQQGFMDMRVLIEEEVEKKLANEPKQTIPEEVKEVYRTVGGVPHLDDNYTVFGEVVEGLDVIDSIATVNTNQMDRPLEDVYIVKVKVLK
ncbi:peptidylprolyl isomerase [Carboxylicivirga mesophila]|uniref:Peptidyl-prolyl cis-trans isomerase n=1 Tax=Carboxylicivirga mesophila TaxID=1166478 RepID=A0ABS5KDR4_9BACT|nr:peptidylprolyl isomerase [Carboxylicivirga mesophila]MBS2213012.1 peptidylprolyl isomerase [Carboxylicivirga mesophila]